METSVSFYIDIVVTAQPQPQPQHQPQNTVITKNHHPPTTHLNLNQPQLQSNSTSINLNFDQPQLRPTSTSINLNLNPNKPQLQSTPTQYGCDTKATQSCFAWFWNYT